MLKLHNVKKNIFLTDLEIVTPDSRKRVDDENVATFLDKHCCSYMLMIN